MTAAETTAETTTVTTTTAQSAESLSAAEKERLHTIYGEKMTVVGDSIAYGFNAYGYISDEQNLAQGSVGIRNIHEFTFTDNDGQEVDVLDALEERQPAYIYMSIGMNDVYMCTEEEYIINYQEAIYPQNYDKMRCLENHDQPRICHYVKEKSDLENYTAFLYFLKGSTLIYAGQEFGCDETPSLFDKDVFPRNTGIDLSNLFAKLDTIKKTVLDDDDYFKADADDENDIAILERDNNKSKKVGIFSLKSKSADVKVDLPDGDYKNEISGETVTVSNGKVHCNGKAIIIRK